MEIVVYVILRSTAINTVLQGIITCVYISRTMSTSGATSEYIHRHTTLSIKFCLTLVPNETLHFPLKHDRGLRRKFVTSYHDSCHLVYWLKDHPLLWTALVIDFLLRSPYWIPSKYVLQTIAHDLNILAFVSDTNKWHLCWMVFLLAKGGTAWITGPLRFRGDIYCVILIYDKGWFLSSVTFCYPLPTCCLWFISWPV